jgi:hypothetical protein
MPSWRDYHRIRLVRTIILRTVDGEYLPLPDEYRAVVEQHEVQSEQ